MIGINDNTFPILSPLLSILMIFGLHYFGIKLIEFFKIDRIISRVSHINFQSLMIGSIVLTVVIQPFIIFNYFNTYFIKVISLFLIVTGTILLLVNLKSILNIKNLFKYKSFKKIFFLILVLGLFLLTLGPITDADSLDYHAGVPIYIINFEQYPNHKFWIHFVKSGPGEILNTLGIVLGADQFPALVQFSAILSIIGIIIKKRPLSLILKDKIILILFFISSPILIFLVPSAKIQLLYVGSSAFVFSSLFLLDKKYLSKNSFIILINILLAAAIAAKFSFAIGSFLLWSIYFFNSIKGGFSKKYILISVIVFSFILLPKTFWKMNIYDMEFIQSIFIPIPFNLYGYEALYNSVSSCGYYGCFPYWVILPRDLSGFTEALGLGSLVIFSIKFKKDSLKLKLFLLLVALQIVLLKIFGPNNARWFLEPFVWLILLVSFFGQNENKFSKILNFSVLLQSFGIMIVIMYGVINIASGSLNTTIRDNVLEKTASGYNLFKWSNSILPKDSILISTHRSFSLSKVKTIPGDIFFYINVKDHRAKTYLEEIKKLNPNYILFYKDKKIFNDIKGCLGELVSYKKNVGSMAKRNPFGRENERYDGYIYKFNYDLLPNCALKN